MEGVSAYRDKDWTPQRLAFHQNLETFAEKVGLIVVLQNNGKRCQESASSEIRSIWNMLKNSRSNLFDNRPGDQA